MTMKLYGIMLIVCVLLFSPAAAWTQEPLSLSDAISRALEQNYDILITRKTSDMTGINNTWGAAGRLPSLSFSTASNNRIDFTDPDNITTNTLSPGISLNWTLFEGFAISIRKQRLETLAEQSSGNVAVLVESTTESVILAYYRALLEHARLDILSEVMTLSKDRYDYTNTSREIGSAVTYEVLQAQNAWLEDKAEFLTQQTTFANAVRDLNYLMGGDGPDDYTFTDEFSAPDTDYQLSDLDSKMRSQNRTLRNQYLNQTLRAHEIALAKSDYYPSLSLRSGLDAAETRSKTGDADPVTRSAQDAYVNLSLDFILFDGGSRKRALQIARVEESISQLETDDMLTSLSIQLAKLYDLYHVRREVLAVAEENLAAAELNLSISEDKFRTGTINSFNYRDVQLTYRRAALNRLQAIYNLIEADTALLRMTGGIITE